MCVRAHPYVHKYIYVHINTGAHGDLRHCLPMNNGEMHLGTILYMYWDQNSSPPQEHNVLMITEPSSETLTVVRKNGFFIPATCNMKGQLVGVSVPPSTPQPASPKENHRESTLGYKLIVPLAQSSY